MTFPTRKGALQSNKHLAVAHSSILPRSFTMTVYQQLFFNDESR